MRALATCRACRQPIRRGVLLCSQCLTPQPHALREPGGRRLQLALLLTILLAAAWFTWNFLSSFASHS